MKDNIFMTWDTQNFLTITQNTLIIMREIDQLDCHGTQFCIYIAKISAP